jgi:hypothetical protein
MPSTSYRQAKTMRAAAHDPEFAKKVGIPQSAAKDFEAADKKAGKKFTKPPASRKTRYANPRKRKMDAANALTGDVLLPGQG